jgi:hypothetical protein
VLKYLGLIVVDAFARKVCLRVLGKQKEVEGYGESLGEMT